MGHAEINMANSARKVIKTQYIPVALCSDAANGLPIHTDVETLKKVKTLKLDGPEAVGVQRLARTLAPPHLRGVFGQNRHQSCFFRCNVSSFSRPLTYGI